MAVPNWKVPMIVETSGAVIVGEESCVGERGVQWLTDEKGTSVDESLTLLPIAISISIARSLHPTLPRRSREGHDGRLGAQGVIHYSLQFCHPYTIESGPVEAELEKTGIPSYAWKLTTARKTRGSSRQGSRHSVKG